jgi:hypothetical protein
VRGESSTLISSLLCNLIAQQHHVIGVSLWFIRINPFVVPAKADRPFSVLDPVNVYSAQRANVELGYFPPKEVLRPG